MKYIVRSRETEVFDFRYIVEADSTDEAEQKVLNAQWEDVEMTDDEYQETVDREILEIEPYNED